MATKKTTPTLRRVKDHEPLQQAEAELKKYQAMVPAARSRVQEADRQVDAARQEVDKVEIGVLAGRMTDADLAVAQGHLADRLRERAISLTAQSDIERMLTLLPKAIAEHRGKGRALVAAHVRQEYQTALQDLRDRLVAAKEANDRALEVYAHARSELDAALGSHPAYHASVLDLADAGLCLPAGGLDRYMIYEPLLDDWRFQEYLKALDQHLAAIPDLPQRDLDRRRALDAANQRSLEHDREIEKQLAEVRRQAEQLARLDQKAPQS